jgi:membrane protein implicated in regulation of membrane protease activity
MRKLATLLGIAGVGIWALGVAAWVSGVWVTLPPDQVKVLVLTVATLSGAVLLAAAAIVGRAANTMANRNDALVSRQTNREISPSPSEIGSLADRSKPVRSRVLTDERG